MTTTDPASALGRPARTSALGGSYGRIADDTARIQFRRGLTLTAMTLLMPGSAQLVSGNKRVGRIALRIWAGVLVSGALLLLWTKMSRSGAFGLVTNPTIMFLGRWLLIAGAIAWVALLLDAWRIGSPLTMRRGHRLTMTALNSVLCFVTAGALLFAAHLVSTGGQVLGTVFAATTSSAPEHGRYNVLLLGGDSGPDRSGVRPDSLTVASIDAETGRTVLIGLPRNLQDVPFPKGTVMHKQFPNGFTCDGCYLNSVNTWANDHASLFTKEGKKPGIAVTKEAVEAITGLKINYYAMVSMDGFSKLVDAVGGVKMTVQERTAIDGIGRPISGYIEAGTRTLNGKEALWYARSRVQNDDFSRMGRQKCVMSAMLHQLNPKSVLLNVEEIADAGGQMLTTDIPRSDLGVFMDLAIKAKSQKVSSVSLVPPAIYTGNPDYDKVRSMIDDAIDRAEGKKVSPKAQKKSGLVDAKLSVAPTNGTSTGADTQVKDPKKANQSSDLTAAC